MMTHIGVLAGEIWLTLDRVEKLSVLELFRILEQKGKSRDLIHMALGWLIYQGHVQWVPSGESGQLRIVASKESEGIHHEESNQNCSAFNVS